MTDKRWFKGNLHTHTKESDGDADPETIVRWFRNHDYDFLVLSDHNHRTILDHGASGSQAGPLLIPGEEVSALVQQGDAAHPVHIGAIGIERYVEPINCDTLVETIQANVNAILGAGGIASINHPNFRWAFDQTHLKQVVGAHLLEIFNGHPGVNLFGAPGKLSNEEIWDAVLSAGRVIWGVAVDDSHHYHDYHPLKANPGRGWVMVNAPDLSSKAIVDAMSEGSFYFSTGIDLKGLATEKDRVSIEIDQSRDFIYTTRFTSKHGVVLKESTGLSASYAIRGDEGYVRATVYSSSGQKAWTQPVFTGGK
ncbi:MAG: hypothetical protein FJ319_03565 [SAR202 cluster bacterium]|nr:hypothetical protein [SAR202 cluster bacterium]